MSLWLGDYQTEAPVSEFSGVGFLDKKASKSQ